MSSQNSNITSSKFIHVSPDIKLENPPMALFASGSDKHVDLFGALSVVALKKPTEMIVFDPIEERQSQGIFDGDDNIDAQIEDIRLVRGKMDNEDPVVLKKRIKEIFNFIKKKKLFLYGTLELEANAFESSLFIDVDQDIISKVEKVHRHFRDGKTFPKLETSGFLKKKLTIRFLGSSIGIIWPKKKKINARDFLINLNNISGFASGIVVANNDVAEFVVLADSLITESQKFDWQMMKILLNDFKKGAKVPICWFRWDFGIPSLEHIWGFEDIKDDPEIQESLQEYDDAIRKMYIDYYLAADLLKIEEQVNFNALPEKQKKEAVEDLMETLEVLEKMLKETETEN
ncbi:MAG: hypothetical protein ACTSYS_07700 [Promethearchaeota archaeon]